MFLLQIKKEILGDAEEMVNQQATLIRSDGEGDSEMQSEKAPEENEQETDHNVSQINSNVYSDTNIF